MPCRTTGGSVRVNPETKRMSGKVGKNLSYGFCGKEWARQGEQAQDWLGIVSSFPVAGPGLIRAEIHTCVHYNQTVERLKDYTESFKREVTHYIKAILN